MGRSLKQLLAEIPAKRDRYPADSAHFLVTLACKSLKSCGRRFDGTERARQRAMSRPRAIEKGVTYLVTRRCFQRQFLLRPSQEVNAFVLFCLAYAAKQSGVLVHGYCVMANHYHVVLMDVEGKLPVFAHLLNMFIGRGVNAMYGRWESFWAPGSYSAVKLVGENDVLAKLVYSLQNPVDAGLVESSKLWPGLCSQPEDMLGKRIEVPRPDHFFRKKGKMPASVTLTLSPPPGVDGERFAANAGMLL